MLRQISTRALLPALQRKNWSASIIRSLSSGESESPLKGQDDDLKAIEGKFKLLFCGTYFPSAYRYTKEELSRVPDVEVTYCKSDEVDEAIEDATMVVPFMSRLPPETIERAKNLKYILQFGVGLEGVYIDDCTHRRIRVGRIPSEGTGNGLSCAEHAIYLTLALLRNQHEMAMSMKKQRLGEPIGQTLAGKTVMVVGFGGIAQNLIPRLKAFDANVIGVRRRLFTQQHRRKLGSLMDALISWKDVSQFLPRVDIVILACTQDRVNFRMIDHKFLERCRPGVKIVNVARGGLLHYDAVLEALRTGMVGGLALDVHREEPMDPEDELMSHPRVVLTPHVAGVTEMSYRNMAKVVASEVKRLKAGQPVHLQINRLH